MLTPRTVGLEGGDMVTGGGGGDIKYSEVHTSSASAEEYSQSQYSIFHALTTDPRPGDNWFRRISVSGEGVASWHARLTVETLVMPDTRVEDLCDRRLPTTRSLQYLMYKTYFLSQRVKF